MSVMNCAVSDRCLLCPGDLSVVLEVAKVSLLWSVKITNSMPSINLLNCFTAKEVHEPTHCTSLPLVSFCWKKQLVSRPHIKIVQAWLRHQLKMHLLTW